MGAIAILYSEELKATMRGRFAWLGAAVILLAIGGLATVGTQDTWLDGYGIIAYGLVPLGFIPLAAGAISAPRANRFVESVFTAPVERRDWFLAKVLVLLTFAAAYYVALVPMLLVYIHHVGLPFLLHRFLYWTPGILVACIAIGTLIGVMFIGRSVAAPAAAGMGILLAYVGLVPLQELMVARGNGATRSGHIALTSPAVLLKNALGFTLAVGSVPATTKMTWISLGAVVIGSFILAIWIFLRTQGVETWETTRPQRWTIALAIAALILLPAVLADTNYDKPAPPANLAPALRIPGRASGNLAMVPPGGQLPRRCCSLILNRDEEALGTDESNRRDLLLLLPVEATQRITDLRVHIAGENGLQATVDAPESAEPSIEPHTYAGEAGPTAEDGHRILNGWIARVPVTLNPTKPWDIGGNRYALNVSADYSVDPEVQPHKFSARAAVEAQVSSAIYEMGAASSVLPLLSFWGGIRALAANPMSAVTEYAIEASGLTRRFGDFVAVDNVTLKIPKGHLYGFLGLNGAGKTTTIRMLTTLLPPSAGTAKLWGRDVVTEALAVRGLVGLVSDETSESQSAWTAREYLSYFARIRHIPDVPAEVERILNDVGLDARFRGKLIGTYSTGMKRRVEIGRALMGSPKVLFLDEPTRGLDLPAKRDMWNLLRRLAMEDNVTTFLSSHDAQEVRSLCTEISVIASGRVVYTGATRDLGMDLDVFEERLIELLTQRNQPA